jgi:hypothetical protein
MEKWVCTVCGYIYDPGAGDPDNEWLQARLLKMCLMIGYVLIVEWAKTSLKRRRKDTGKDTMEA